MKDLSLLKKKLAGYSAMAASVIAFTSDKVEAQIIYHDIDPDIFLDGPSSNAILDLNNDGITDFKFTFSSDYESDCAEHSGESVFGLNGAEFIVASSSGSYAIAIGTTEEISGDQQFWDNNASVWWHGCHTVSSYGGCTCSNFGLFYGHFVGIQFSDTDGIHYGWIRIDLQGPLIKDYAYQLQPDSSIFAGQTDNCDTVHVHVTPEGSVNTCTSNPVVLVADYGTPSFFVHLQWQKNSVNTSVADHITVNSAGDYRIIISGYGCSDTSNTVTVLSHPNPSPVPSRTADTLYSNYVTGNYWIFNSDTISFAESCLIGQNGYYGLQNTDSMGCHSSIVYAYETICNDIVHSNFNPYPPIDSVCETDSVHLLCNYCCWTTYQWLINGNPITGANSIGYYADSTGTYSLIISNTINCFDTSEVWQLTMLQNPDPILSQFSDSLVSNYPTGNQWYLNGIPIPGATNQTFIPIQSGSYQVEVTDSNGCIAISELFVFIATNIGNTLAVDFFDAFVEDHHLHIHFNQSPLPSRMTLFNDLGVKLREAIITKNELVMDVSQLGTGIYFVAVDNQNKRSVKKVVIK